MSFLFKEHDRVFITGTHRNHQTARVAEGSQRPDKPMVQLRRALASGDVQLFGIIDVHMALVSRKAARKSGG